MRRWNGWGEERVDMRLPPQALQMLTEILGRGSPPRDAAWEAISGRVPPSRLSDHPWMRKDPGTRIRHSRGQSLPDWIALRSGRIPAFPDGVAYPDSPEQVRDLLRYAEQAGAEVIPFGGGTSVVGHVNPRPGQGPVLTLDTGRMIRLTELDPVSRIATFGAGVRGPDLEAQLRARGFTLGHYPQSFEYSTLGGWVSTRSTGQQSLYYGRIEQMFAGGRLETPSGTLVVPAHPASAAGPDLREMVLGSEGRAGVLTEVTVRVRPLPGREEFRAAFFPCWEAGLEAVRRTVQSGISLSMLRLSSAAETRVHLALSGGGTRVRNLESWLARRGAGAEKCLVIWAVTGSRAHCRAVHRALRPEFRAARGWPAQRFLGRHWAEGRFQAPYLRNTLWEHGYAVDTLETAVDWSRVPEMATSLEAVLTRGLEEDREAVMAFSHLSHVYPQGASVYVTFLFRAARDPESTLRRWRRLKHVASETIVRLGGTISHQHGVGSMHLPYVSAEKGSLGVAGIRALLAQWDPRGIMNPGKLLPAEPPAPHRGKSA